MRLIDEARRRLQAAYAVVGWSNEIDPGENERDRLVTAHRRLAYWLACGDERGLRVAGHQLSTLVKLSGQSVRRALHAMREYPSRVNDQSVEAAVTAYRAALDGQDFKPLSSEQVLAAYSALLRPTGPAKRRGRPVKGTAA